MQDTHNGGHERMHLDVRFELEDFSAATVADQQRAFDDWLTTFNHVRPHEALGQRVPAEVYRVSERRIARHVAVGYPDDYREVKLDGHGGLRHDGRHVYVGYALANWTVGLKPQRDGRVEVWFFHMLLGAFVAGRDKTLQPYADVVPDELSATSSAADPNEADGDKEAPPSAT